MLGYLIMRRLVRLVLTVLLACSLVFFALRVIPGDAASIIGGLQADPTELDQVRRRIGADRPLAIQYLDWLRALATLDLGNSLLTDESVAQLLLERLPTTLILAAGGFIAAVLIALPIGLWQAERRNHIGDWLGNIFTYTISAAPEFWIAILLLLLFAVRFPLLPLFGDASPRHYILPIATLAISRAAVLARIVRATAIEQSSRAYIVVARAKGLPPHLVRYRHLLRGALLSITTLAAAQLGYLLGGAVVAEQIFSLPGLGNLLIGAVRARDLPVVQGATALFAIIFACLSFIVDLVYMVANPKIRSGV